MAALRLEHVVARNVSRLRLAAGMSQSQLAWWMVKQGRNWTANRVTQVETLRRPVGLHDMSALCAIFEVDMFELLAGDDDVERPDGSTEPLEYTRLALQGRAHKVLDYVDFRPGVAPAVISTPSDVVKAAKRLDLAPDVLEWLSVRTYGRSFIAERDTRAGDLSELTPASARTKRGHATRSILSQLDQILMHQGRDELIARIRHDTDPANKVSTEGLPHHPEMSDGLKDTLSRDYPATARVRSRSPKKKAQVTDTGEH